MDNEFIKKYSKLIYKITHYFEGYPHKEDLYQAGCVGLMMAYQNYNEEYGTKFSTYAYTYILGEMNKRRQRN
jgi:RNA polymerase sporulation-specific sigma factor